MNSLQANWNYPTDIRLGAGRIAELGDACLELGIRAPMLVTDPGLVDLPMVEDSINSCADAGLTCRVFSQIQANPSGQNVMQGVLAYHQENHDGVIALGGGSALDAAKAVALMAGQNRPIWDFEDIGDNWKRVNSEGVASVIAVPTTAGTGSEVGRASVITDTDRKLKKIIFHPKILPSIVILDPELTVGLPPAITAATGMDALSHNLEALCSPFYHPMAEGIAVEGIRRVKENLPLAYSEGNNIEARTQMLVASSMGATAFQKGLGAMHALAHSLGALYGTHHGLLNAILMPYVLIHNKKAISDRLNRLSLWLELEEPGFNAFLSWVLELRQQLGIAHTLAEVGIDLEQADLVGKMAVNDPSAGANPIAFSSDEYRMIFQDAVKGKCT